MTAINIIKECVLVIQFCNEDMTYETYKSPKFDSPKESLWDNEVLDNLVVDGDDETDFFINCDAEGNLDNGLHTITWLMFDAYDPKWVEQLMEVWERHLDFKLPAWETWVKV